MRRTDYREPGTVWRAQLFTEMLGPVGRGWGTEQVSFSLAEGIATVVAKAWIVDPGTREIRHSRPYEGTSPVLDGDCLWSATEDAVNKALAELEDGLPYRSIPLSAGCCAYVDQADYPAILISGWGLSPSGD